MGSRPSGPIFDVVCGLPARRRWEWLIVALQAYIDGSGSPPHSPVLVLAGWIATSGAWSEFSDEWDAALRMSPRIECFKMSQWVKHRDPQLRDERLKMLYRIIERHVAALVTVTVPFGALETALKVIPAEHRPLAKIRAYQIAWSSIMGGLYRYQTGLGLHERVDFIFDEEKMEQTALLAGWEEMISTTPDEWKHMVGAVPKFEDDALFLPLQAADLLAWLRRDQWESLEFGRPAYVPPWTPTREIRGLDTVYGEAELTRIIGNSYSTVGPPGSK